MRTGPGANVLGVAFATALFAAAPPGTPIAERPPDAPVAEAAERGDLEAVRALLRQGADVNAAQGDGMTALHWAALNGHTQMAEVLLYAGARPEATTRLGEYRPLHLAARAGHAEVLAALLARGSDPNAPTATGARALHLAAASGSAKTVSALLEAGAEVDAPESAAGQTPLLFAAAAGRVEALRALLDAGADPSIASRVVDYAAVAEADGVDRKRRQEILAAVRKAEEEARAALAGEAAEEEAVAPGAAPAQGEGRQPAEARRPAEPAAATGGAAARPEEAGKPTTREGVPDAAAELKGEEGVAGEAPSTAAAATDQDAAKPTTREGVPDAAAELKGEEGEAVAREETPGEGGDEAEGEKAEEPKEEPPRPLSYAELVGAQGGMTALHYALRDGHRDCVEALLEAGADIDQVTGGDRSSPLLLAAINGQYDLASYLLSRGADPTLASADGVTPLYAAIANRWAPKALYPQPTAFKQQEASYLDLMKALLEAGADPNVRLTKHIWYSSFNFDLLGVDFQGATPFWRAAHATDVPAMQLLAAYGADPSIPTKKPPERRRRQSDDEEGEEEEEDPSGLSPVEVGGPGVPPIVAASGVGYGRTRAGNSHRHAPDGWLPAVKYLVEELGADVNARDHDGFTPLHYAAARGDNELILYLVEKGADPTLIARTGQTTVDMANGPIQRVQPFFDTIALLEGMGAKNNDKCVSC